jgi:hypothetical protein
MSQIKLLPYFRRLDKALKGKAVPFHTTDDSVGGVRMQSRSYYLQWDALALQLFMRVSACDDERTWVTLNFGIEPEAVSQIDWPAFVDGTGYLGLYSLELDQAPGVRLTYVPLHNPNDAAAMAAAAMEIWERLRPLPLCRWIEDPLSFAPVVVQLVRAD